MRTANQGQERHPDGPQPVSLLGSPQGCVQQAAPPFSPSLLCRATDGELSAVPPFRAKEEILQAAAGDFWLTPGSNQGRVFGSLACLPPSSCPMNTPMPRKPATGPCSSTEPGRQSGDGWISHHKILLCDSHTHTHTHGFQIQAAGRPWGLPPPHPG
uniref:Uncharacterized protein n=1 Tax=Micrurus corallinus TaxID=54390 RepID=A0A2D4G078_MICCO